MVEFIFNGQPQFITSVESLSDALDRFDATPQFEVWASTHGDSSMCMLRNHGSAWLMYLRRKGDSGFNSVGNKEQAGSEKYLLSNGQTDEYPLAWCIDIEQCYKALAYFYVNDGARPDWVVWEET